MQFGEKPRGPCITCSPYHMLGDLGAIRLIDCFPAGFPSLTYILLYSLVETCPALTSVANAYLSTPMTEYGTIVTITCNHGYQFSLTNDTSMDVQCIDGSQWNTSISSCIGTIRFANTNN